LICLVCLFLFFFFCFCTFRAVEWRRLDKNFHMATSLLQKEPPRSELNILCRYSTVCSVLQHQFFRKMRERGRKKNEEKLSHRRVFKSVDRH
jgi:hypothetical protein